MVALGLYSLQPSRSAGPLRRRRTGPTIHRLSNHCRWRHKRHNPKHLFGRWHHPHVQSQRGADDGAGHKGTSTAFNILATTDLGLSGSSQIFGAPPLRTGMTLGFNLLVTNRGPASAVNTFLLSALPSNVSFVSATNSQGSLSN